jgi:outer membrane receptor protein involved in Fe transport
MRITRTMKVALLIGGCVATYGAPALAQSQPAELTEIVVTAQKREQSAIEVPITMTAYSGAMLEKLDVRDFHDLTQFTPGFYVQNQSVNDAGFVMRGVTTDTGDIVDEPRVSVFQDGVDISKSRGSYVELFDVQRVEVDKGPQSTLYGRSALIGAVDIIQNKASEAGFDWNLRAEGGNYAYGLVEGMVNLPVSDTLAVRVAGRYRRRDGYIPNLLGGDDFNSVDTGAVRMAVNWRPIPELNSNFIFNYERDTPSGASFKNQTFLPTNPLTGQVLGDTRPYTGAALSAPADFSEGSKLGVDRKVWGVTEMADYQLGPHLKLSSITAYRRFASLEVFDPDGFSFPLLTAAEDTWDDQLSQEFRLNFEAGSRFSGFVGVNYFGDNGQYKIPIEVDERAVLALQTGLLNRTNPVPTSLGVLDSPATTTALLEQAFGVPAFLAGPIAANIDPAHQEAYATGSRTRAFDIYGDVTWHATDALDVSAGLRGSFDHKTTTFASWNITGASVLGALLKAPTVANALAAAVPGRPNLPNYGAQTNPTANNGQTDSATLDDNGASWRLNALYKLGATSSVYATYARGRRPAVLAATGPAQPGGPAQFTIAPAETVDDWEVGAKSLTLDHRLDIAGAAYYYKYNNFQTTVQQGTQFVTTNAGKADDYGFEGQATFRATPLLDLFGTYTYSRGRFDSGLYKGNHFRLTPDHMVSLGLSARYPALGGLFEFTPTAVYRSKVFFDDDNAKPQLLTGALITPLVFNEFQGGYGLLDLRLSYRPDAGNWRVEAFVTNAADTRYLKDAGNTGEDIGLPTYIAGEPRMFGFALSMRR